MKNLLLNSLLAIILASCSDNGRNESANIHADSMIKKEDSNNKKLNYSVKEVQDTINPKSDKIGTNILGIWAMLGEQNANFEIEKDKILYPEQSKSYKYKIVKDSIKIKYGSFEGVYAVRMRGTDTLILTGDQETIYYRFK